MDRSAVVAHVAVPLLGVATGMRSFTPLAVAAWFARSGRLPVAGTWASWMAHPAAVGVLTAGACGEYVGDALPGSPDRTDTLPLLGRMGTGALAGAVVASAFRQPVLGGIALGVLGAVAGTFGGFYARRALTQAAGGRDLPVAMAGDMAAIALAVAVLRRLK